MGPIGLLVLVIPEGNLRVHLRLPVLRLIRKSALILLALCCQSFAARAQHPTLDRIRERGALLCGVDRSQAEYSSTDEHGSRTAFDKDLCKAVAVAALGEQARIVFTFYADDATSRQALLAGKADVIASLSHDPHEVGVGYTEPVFFDDTALLVPLASGIKNAAQLRAKKICFLSETNTEEHVNRYFAVHSIDFLPFPFQEEGEMEAAFVTNNCAALAGDLTRLAQTRADAGSHADEFAILPEVLGSDTLSIAFRKGDAAWAALVDGVRNELVAAELAGPGGPEKDAAQGPLKDVLKAVGNYGELFERDLGMGSGLKLSRGRSALVGHGGELDLPKKSQQH